ncbi:MAG: helix-turn-helix domain-containing protein [Propionibacterium sp.]|nr:helix-turn-helix domain-containing protein [Propionibacterium sp.]
MTPDQAQLAVAPGDPCAVRPYAEADDTGVIRGWLELVRARSGLGTTGLRTRLELGTVAGRYNARCRGAMVLVARMAPEHTRAWLELALAVSRSLVAQAKRVRVLLPCDACDLPPVAAFVESAIDLGVALHVAPEVDSSLIHWNGLGVVYFVGGRMRLDTGGPDAIAELLGAWLDAADPLRHVTRRRVVRLLAAGHTDAVAARKLGISERQFRRHVSGLMLDLDAGSRFQAGIEAARSMQW